MSGKTKIEWATDQWNPVTGCSKVSQGCKNCYAEREWPRLAAPRTLPNIYTGRTFTDVRCHPAKLDIPLRWTKPRKIFVNSMSDLFHQAVPFEFIDKVFAVMALCPQHTFQVLTKRPERMLGWFQSDPYERVLRHADAIRSELPVRVLPHRIGVSDPTVIPYRNVWLGVSVEDQLNADERIPLLMKIPAAVRWISAEPLLGPIEAIFRCSRCQGSGSVLVANGGKACPDCFDNDFGGTGWRQIDWVVIGGESGPTARPFNVDWARNIIAQCKVAGVPVFMKQIGSQPRGWCAWHTSEIMGKNDADRIRAEGNFCDHYEASEQAKPCESYGHRCMMLKDRKGGEWSEWPEDLRIREYP